MEGPVAAEPLAPPPQLEHRLLRDVLGRFLIAQHPLHVAHELRIPGPEDLVERPGVPRA